MKRMVMAAVVLIAVVGAAWYFQRKDENIEREERAEARLLSFSDRDVVGLDVQIDGADWRFVREEDVWRVVEPVQDLADGTNLSDMLAAMQRSRVTDVIEDPAELSSYGLDPAKAIYQVAGPEVPELRIGNPLPTAAGGYAVVEGRDGVLTLGLQAFPLLEPKLDQLRDTRVLDINRSEVERFTLTEGGDSFTMAREGDVWWVVEPFRMPASSARIERLLATLDSLAVSGYRDGMAADDASFGFDDGLALSVQGKGLERELRIGAVEGVDRYVHRADRPSVMLTEAAPLASVATSLDKLGNNRLTNVNRYQVTRFSYDKGGANFSAENNGDAWVTGDGRSWAAEDAAGFLVKLLEAPVKGWKLSNQAPGAAIASFEFETADGKDRVDFYGGDRARVASLPHLTYQMRAAPASFPEIE
ncbi:hypothetical protein ABI59_04220 [Acidobacteria bacterium Mor1]|nr:hypothetical protein ABI59_04220 [Acidobacteria bacterium Mor1]